MNRTIQSFLQAVSCGLTAIAIYRISRLADQNRAHALAVGCKTYWRGYADGVEDMGAPQRELPAPQ